MQQTSSTKKCSTILHYMVVRYCIAFVNLYIATLSDTPIRGTPNVVDPKKIREQKDGACSPLIGLWVMGSILTISRRSEAGRSRAGACASEILGVWRTSNVNVIAGTHYFHQSNFCFRQYHFHPEKIYLLRIVCIDPASISVKKELFSSKLRTLRNNSMHPSQG